MVVTCNIQVSKVSSKGYISGIGAHTAKRSCPLRNRCGLLLLDPRKACPTTSVSLGDIQTTWQTHCSAASISRRFTCSLASFTIALAWRSALSASLSAASAFKTRSRAARIEGSSSFRWRSPLRGLALETEVACDETVAVGEGSRCFLNKVLLRRGSVVVVWSGGGAVSSVSCLLKRPMVEFSWVGLRGKRALITVLALEHLDIEYFGSDGKGGGGPLNPSCLTRGVAVVTSMSIPRDNR